MTKKSITALNKEETRLQDVAELLDLEKVDVFLERTGLSRVELKKLFYQDLSPSELQAQLSHLFYINDVKDGLGPLNSKLVERYHITEFTIRYLQAQQDIIIPNEIRDEVAKLLGEEYFNQNEIDAALDTSLA